MHTEWDDFIFGATPRCHGTSRLHGGRSPESPVARVTVDALEVSPTTQTIEDALLEPFSFSSFRNFFIMYCSFADGLDRGLRLPIIFLLKTKYMLSQAVAFIAYGLSLTPWLAKPCIAVVTDTVPIFGLRRKPYVIASAWVNSLSLGGIAATTATQVGGYILPMSLMTVRTFCRSLTRAVVQGMLLEDCAEGGQATTTGLITQFHTSHRLGQFASVLASGILLSTNSFLTVFLGVAAFHAGSILLATLLEEAPAPVDASSSHASISQKLDELQQIVSSEPGFYPVLQYAFWAMTCPNYEARMAYYLLDERHFSVFELSLVSTAQTVASLFIPSIYNHLYKDAPLQPLLSSFTLATVPAALLPLLLTTGVSDSLNVNPVAVAVISGFALTAMNDLQMMPANVLVAQMARKGMEGSMYSIFTLVDGVGRVVSEFYVGIVPVALGAAAWNSYTNMSAYIAVSGLFQLTPLVSVNEIPRNPSTLPKEIRGGMGEDVDNHELL
jgi:hypothetical protein